MTKRGTILIWSVAAVVTLFAGAMSLRLTPDGPNLETVGALVLGLCILGGITALSLHFSNRQRESRAQEVERLDSALRAMAREYGDEFVEGGAYSHPMIGSILYPGRVHGTRGSFRFELVVVEDENGMDLLVKAGPVRGKKTVLTPRTRDLSPGVRQRVQELRELCDRIAVEAFDPPTAKSAGPACQGEFYLVVTKNGTFGGFFLPDALRRLVQRTLALASELSTS